MSLGDISALQNAQKPPKGDQSASLLAVFLGNDSTTTLGSINKAFCGDGKSAFQANVLPDVKLPPKEALTKNDISYNVPLAMAPVRDVKNTTVLNQGLDNALQNVA